MPHQFWSEHILTEGRIHRKCLDESRVIPRSRAIGQGAKHGNLASTNAWWLKQEELNLACAIAGVLLVITAKTNSTRTPSVFGAFESCTWPAQCHCDVFCYPRAGPRESRSSSLVLSMVFELRKVQSMCDCALLPRLQCYSR